MQCSFAHMQPRSVHILTIGARPYVPFVHYAVFPSALSGEGVLGRSVIDLPSKVMLYPRISSGAIR
jgi:hypothetical protein